MKKLSAISAALLAAVFLVLPGLARSGIVDLATFTSGVDAAQSVDPTLDSPPNDSGHDFAVGGGHHLGFVGGPCNDSEPNCTNTGFSAHSGPAGENPQGHISSQSSSPGGKLRGDVICLGVTGNVAELLAVETRSGDAIPQGQQFLLEVVDNGNPVNGTPPDLIRGSFDGFFVPLPGPPCAIPFLPPVPLGSGNIVVHDELP